LALDGIARRSITGAVAIARQLNAQPVPRLSGKDARW
jgi:hypothetical protein